MKKTIRKRRIIKILGTSVVVTSITICAVVASVALPHACAAGMPMHIKYDIYVQEGIVASGRVLGMVVQLLRQITYS